MIEGLLPDYTVGDYNVLKANCSFKGKRQNVLQDNIFNVMSRGTGTNRHRQVNIMLTPDKKHKLLYVTRSQGIKIITT